MEMKSKFGKVDVHLIVLLNGHYLDKDGQM